MFQGLHVGETIGIQSGFDSKFACNYIPVVASDKFALLEAGTGTTLASAMGLGAQLPDHYVILTAADGGADKIGTGDLDQASATPLFQQASATLGINVVEIDGTTDIVGATSATDWDVADESMTLLYIGDGTGAMLSGRVLFGKGSTAAGYALRASTNGQLIGYIFNTSGTKSVECKYNHYTTQGRGHLIAMMLRADRAADVMQLITNLGESAATTAHLYNSTNAVTAKVGYSSGIAAAAAHQGALVALWKGTNGEGITRDHFENLLDYLGLGIFNDVL